MKIRIENKSKKELENLKTLISDLLNTSFEDMELTDENIKKARMIKETADMISSFQFRFKGLDIKIVNSDGAELTTII